MKEGGEGGKENREMKKVKEREEERKEEERDSLGISRYNAMSIVNPLICVQLFLHFMCCVFWTLSLLRPHSIFPNS